MSSWLWARIDRHIQTIEPKHTLAYWGKIMRLLFAPFWMVYTTIRNSIRLKYRIFINKKPNNFRYFESFHRNMKMNHVLSSGLFSCVTSFTINGQKDSEQQTNYMKKRQQKHYLMKHSESKWFTCVRERIRTKYTKKKKKEISVCTIDLSFSFVGGNYRPIFCLSNIIFRDNQIERFHVACFLCVNLIMKFICPSIASHFIRNSN